MWIHQEGLSRFLTIRRNRRGRKSYPDRSNGVCLKDAINHKRGRSDYAIHKTMTKLPGYIKYIEKEYGIAVLEQSKRKLQEAA